MNDKEWIDRLRHDAQEFEEPAPVGLWDDIDKALAPGSPAKTPKIMPLWLRLSGIAAAVALLVGIGICLYMLNEQPSKEVIFAETTTPTTPPVDVDDEQKSLSSEMVAENNLTQNSTHIPKQYSPPAATPSAEVITQTVDEECGIKAPVDTASNPVSSTPVDKVDTKKEEYYEQYIAASDIEIVIPKEDKSVALSAYAGNMMMNHQTVQSGYGPMLGSLIPNDGDLTDIPVGNSPASDILLSNQDEEVETKTTHRLPVRFGMNVSIPVYDRLSVETGLTYSILSSTIESGTPSNMFDTDQTLHYIGIPLKATYDILNSGSIGLYATAGGMVEKCVYGRSITDFVMGSDVASSESERISERQLQFSVMAGVGVKWNITKSLNLFAEPGISYYIDNHSDIVNSYKDKPFNFDLKIGLRFNLKP